MSQPELFNGATCWTDFSILHNPNFFCDPWCIHAIPGCLKWMIIGNNDQVRGGDVCWAKQSSTRSQCHRPGSKEAVLIAGISCLWTESDIQLIQLTLLTSVGTTLHAPSPPHDLGVNKVYTHILSEHALPRMLPSASPIPKLSSATLSPPPQRCTTLVLLMKCLSSWVW